MRGKVNLLSLTCGVAIASFGISMPARAQITFSGPCICPGATPQLLNGGIYQTAGGIYYGAGLDVPSVQVPGSCAPASASFNGTPLTDSTCLYGGDPIDGFTATCESIQDDSLFASGTQISAVTHCTGYQCNTPNPNDCTFQDQPAPAVAFVLDNAPPIVKLTSAPTNGTIISGLQPITMGGTIASASPSTVTFDTSGGRDVQSGIFSFSSGTGGNWALSIDSTTLVSLATIIGGGPIVNSTGLITLGVFATDIVGNTVSYSSDGFSEAVNPNLAVQVYIDFTPPVVTFDLGTSTTVTTLSVISGVITDNFKLGSLALSIQDLTDPASSYWLDSGGFKAADPIEIPIGINKSAGATSSTWTYTGIGDTFRTPGHAYRVSAIAVDSANNVSTTTLTLSLPSIAKKTVSPIQAGASVSGLIQFTNPTPPFTVQYGRTQIICAHPNSAADPKSLPTDMSQLDLRDDTHAISQFTPIANAPDCNPGDLYEWKVLSDSKKCLDQVDNLNLFFNGLVATAEIDVLLPTGATEAAFYASANGLTTIPHNLCRHDPFGMPPSPIVNCIDDIYLVKFVGPPLMDLDMQLESEEITLPSQYAGLPYCTESGNAPQQVIGSTEAISNHMNKVTDKQGYLSGDLFAANSDYAATLIEANAFKQMAASSTNAPRVWTCGAIVFQHWYVNACRIPRAGPDISHRHRLNMHVSPKTSQRDLFIGASLRTDRSDESPPHLSGAP